MKLQPGQVHTLDTIKERCIEDGDCWLWQFGKSHGSPFLKHSGKAIPVRRYILEELQGRKIKKNLLISSSCECLDCVNPDHIKLMTRQGVQARTAKRTSYGANKTRKMKIAKSAQARSGIGWELVRSIRQMDGSGRSIAKELGMHYSVVNDIRRHKTWKETANPFAGLM